MCWSITTLHHLSAAYVRTLTTELARQMSDALGLVALPTIATSTMKTGTAGWSGLGTRRVRRVGLTASFHQCSPSSPGQFARCQWHAVLSPSCTVTAGWAF